MEHTFTRTSHGVCTKAVPGSPFDCELGSRGAWRAGAMWNLTSLSECAERCRQCRRCAYAAYSRCEQACMWSAECAVPFSTPRRFGTYLLMQVRDVVPPAPRLDTRHRCGAHRRPSEAPPPAPPVVGALSREQLKEGCGGYASVLYLPKKWRVACIGDSITRGDATHEYGRGSHAPFKRAVAIRGNYPAVLQALLGSERYVVGAFARSGRSASEGPNALRDTDEWRSVRCFEPHVAQSSRPRAPGPKLQ
jgi:hypothetical protein